jgi:hypothetical protein
MSNETNKQPLAIGSSSMSEMSCFMNAPYAFLVSNDVPLTAVPLGLAGAAVTEGNQLGLNSAALAFNSECSVVT